MTDDDLVPMLQVRAQHFSDLLEIRESGTEDIRESTDILILIVIQDLIKELQELEADMKEASK